MMKYSEIVKWSCFVTQNKEKKSVLIPSSKCILDSAFPVVLLIRASFS